LLARNTVALILLLLSAATAVAAPPAEIDSIPFRHFTFSSPWQVGPVIDDGKAVLVGAGTSVHVLSTEDGRIIRSFERYYYDEWSTPSPYLYSPQEDRVYTFENGEVRAWDWRTGAQLFSHESFYAFRPSEVLDDGTWVYYGFYSETRFVDPETGETIRNFYDPNFLEILDVSQDGTKALLHRTPGRINGLDVRDTRTGEVLASYDPPGDAYEFNAWYDFSPDASRIVRAQNVQGAEGRETRLTFIDAATGIATTETLPGDLRGVRSWTGNGIVFNYSRNGGKGVEPSYGIAIYDPDEIDSLRYLKLSSYDLPRIEVNLDGTSVSVLNGEPFDMDTPPPAIYGRVETYDLDSFQQTSDYPFHYQASIEMASSEVGRFAFLDEYESVTVRDFSGVLLSAWRPNNDYIFDPDITRGRVSLSADGTKAATMSHADKEVYIHDVATGEELRKISGVSRQYESVAPSFSPDGKLIFFGAYPYPANIWNVADGQSVFTSNRHVIGLTGASPKEILYLDDSVSFQPVLKRAPYDNLAAASVVATLPYNSYTYELSGNGEVLVEQFRGAQVIDAWRVSTGAAFELQGPDGLYFWQVTLSHDGSMLANEGNWGSTYIIDTETNEVLRKIRGYSGPAKFTADGKWLVIGGIDTTVWATSSAVCEEACAGETTDTDGDTLTDCFERCIGTRLWMADSDGDYLPDGHEFSAGLDPGEAESSLDSDGDGLVDVAELYLGTNPENVDSDADGYPDRRELDNGANPLLVDWFDELETAVVLAAFHEADTSGDGYLRWPEFAALLHGSLTALKALDFNADSKLSTAELQRRIEKPKPIHTADLNADGELDFGELMRIIQLYNGGGYICPENPNASEDGYVLAEAELSGVPCPPHSSDYLESPDGIISLSELLRAIQIFSASYQVPCESDDGFCLGWIFNGNTQTSSEMTK
jgi:WD40 repeat protein